MAGRTCAAWVARDAARGVARVHPDVVLRRQRAVIVERAEGRELIDVDGRRYLDAISSLWVTTLGHHVPELDAGAARPARPRRPLDAARQRQPHRRSSSPRRSPPVVPVDEPHFLFASDGAAAVEQALKIAFQYWTNQGVTGRDPYLAFGGAYHGDTIGVALRRRRRLRHRRVRPAALPGASRARPTTPSAAVGAASTRTRPSWPRSSSSRSCRARRAWRSTSPSFVAAVADACRGARRAADRATRSPPASAAPARCSPSSSAACAPTCCASARASPAATCRWRPRSRSRRVYDAFLGPDLSRADPLPRALLQRERPRGRGRAAPPAAARRVGRARQRARAGPSSSACCSPSASRRSPRCGEVRRRGLMTGVELAPPADGLRWGRRVSAPRACAAGVLIRPLGDVIVLMPPLTITADEIERIVDVRRRRPIAEVRRDVTLATAHRVADRDGDAHPATAGPVARRSARSTARGTGVHARRRPRRSCRSRRTTTSGLTPAPRGRRRRRTTRVDRWGTGSGLGPPDRRRPAGAPRARGRAGRWKGTERALLFPTGFAANLGVLTTLGDATACCVVQRRAEPRVDHRRLPAGSRRRVAIARHADLDHLDALLAGARRAGDRRHRHRVLDGRRRRPARRPASRVCAAPRRAARARRGPRRARSGPTPPPTADGCCCASARCRRRSARSAASSPGRGRSSTSCVNAARPFIFTTAPTPGGHRRRARRAARAALRRRRRRWSHGSAPTSTASRPGTRRRSSRSCSATRSGAVGASARLLDEHGLLVPAIRPPTVAARHVPPARRAVRRAHRRPGRPPGQGPRRASGCHADVTLVVCVGTAPSRQDLGRAPPSLTARCERAA